MMINPNVIDLEVERRLSGERVYRGHFLQINRDTVLLPDGRETIREYIVHPGASMVIPLRADGQVLIEHQFRYPMHRTFIEFPAGKLDADEAPLTCAKRELLEETGLVAAASDWYYLTSIHNAIAYSDEVIHLYLAKNVEQTNRAAPQGSEQWMRTGWVTPEAILEQVRTGQTTDVKTVIGAFWLNQVLNQGWTMSQSALESIKG